MRKVWSATIHCSVTLRQAQNPGLSASKSGEEVKSKWIGVIGKKLIGHVCVYTREKVLNQRTSSPRRIKTIHSSRSSNRTEDRLFLSIRSRPNAMTAKNKTFWESTHAQQRQIPLEWDQLTGNASGEHRQIQLGGKYKSIRNENGWQELECTWRDIGWDPQNCPF